MWRYLAFFGVALVVYAFIDALRSERSERVGVPLPVWLLLIVALPVVGALGWLIISRVYGRTAGSGPEDQPRPARPPKRPGPIAPDDDPEFLARLRHQLGEQGRDPDRPDRGQADR